MADLAIDIDADTTRSNGSCVVSARFGTLTPMHPLADMIPKMIENMGAEVALEWWMRWGVQWEGTEGLSYSREAIEAMAKGDEDHVISDADGYDLARAFQWVRLFDLEAFVEASDKC